jgi:hypothetical protein
LRKPNREYQISSKSLIIVLAFIPQIKDIIKVINETEYDEIKIDLGASFSRSKIVNVIVAVNPHNTKSSAVTVIPTNLS